jgi:hypothetical protein
LRNRDRDPTAVAWLLRSRTLGGPFLHEVPFLGSHMVARPAGVPRRRCERSPGGDKTELDD